MKTISQPKQGERTYIRKCRVFLSQQNADKFDRAMEVSNQLHNYALSKLERMYGYSDRHRDRKFPRGKRVYLLVNEIKSGFALEKFGLSRWIESDIGLAAQQANELIALLVANFKRYLSGVYSFSNQPLKHKRRWEAKHGRPWWRKGAIEYIRRNGKKSKRSVTIPDNGGTIKLVDDKHIKLPTYGIVRMQRSFKKMMTNGDRIAQARIKRIRDGLYELQLVLSTKVEKRPISKEVGFDWCMKGDSVFHGTVDGVLSMAKEVVAKADQLEMKIRKLQAELKRTKSEPHRKKVLRALQRTYAKRSNVIRDEHRRLAKAIAGKYDLVAVEKLSPASMRKLGSGNPQSKGFNRKLSLRKPGELMQILKSAVVRAGGTFVEVDPYMTSQVEFETGHVPAQKRPLSVRQWISPVNGKIVDRDENAAWNILSWALIPELHAKHKKLGVDPDDLVTIS